MRTTVAVAVLAASGILPVLAVRRVDPVKIIRAKERRGLAGEKAGPQQDLRVKPAARDGGKASARDIKENAGSPKRPAG